MTTPSFNSLYTDAKSTITSDPDLQVNDYSDGSWLDAFTAVAVSSAQAVVRYGNKQLGRFYRNTAKDADLDNYIADHFGDEIVREDGESNDDLNARLDDYIRNGLTRGTLPALQWMLENRIEGIADGSASVEQDTLSGLISLNFTAEEGTTVSEINARILAIYLEWAPGSRGVNLYGKEFA